MSKSYWIAAVALGLAVLSVVGWSIFQTGFSIGENAGEYQAKSSTYARHAKQEIGNTCAGLNGVAQTECIRNIIEATNQHKRSEGDLIAQRNMSRWALWMLIATALMAIVTAVGVYFVWQTLRDTRRIGEAQVRAYLTIENGTVTPQTGELDRVFWYIGFDIRNCGQSPAKRITAHASGDIFGADGHSALPDLAAGSKASTSIILTTKPDDLRFIDADQTKVIFKAHIMVQFSDVFAKTGDRTEVHADFVGVVRVVNDETSTLTNAGTAISEHYIAEE